MLCLLTQQDTPCFLGCYPPPLQDIVLMAWMAACYPDPMGYLGGIVGLLR